MAAALCGMPACGGGGATTPGTASSVSALSTQENQCLAAGWQRETVQINGVTRQLLRKQGPGASGAALVVLHGGGGSYTNFCVANVALIEPQVRFTELALARGYSVLLLDSTDQVSDVRGRLCGKVWDDELRGRANLDLPFLDKVLLDVIPRVRAGLPRQEVFLVGHSSGGYMATRAASAFGARITAFAPVSAGDPYGWTRDCTPLSTDRSNVFGIGADNDTGLGISTPGACDAAPFPQEKPWDTPGTAARPAFRAFHHRQDGINDLSCVLRARRQLVAHGYAEVAPLTLDGGNRSTDVHYWLDDYNGPILDFFATRALR